MTSISAVFQAISFAAMLSFGYYLATRSANAANRSRISRSFSGDTIRAWIPGMTLSLSAESFRHHVFSEYLQRNVPCGMLYGTLSLRNLGTAAELLLIIAAIRIVPPHAAYLCFAASFFIRLYGNRRLPHAGSILFGAGLFLLPLLHPEMILTNETRAFLSAGVFSPGIPGGMVSIAMVSALLLLAAARETGFLPLMSFVLFLDHSTELSTATFLAFSCAVIAGSVAPFVIRGIHLGPRGTVPRRVLLAETLAILLILLTGAAAAFPVPAMVLLPAAFLSIAALESIPALLHATGTTTTRTPAVSDPLDLLERDNFFLCTHIEYIESATALLFSCVTANISTLKELIMKLQNAGTLADETRTLRKHITREEGLLLNTGERIHRATHLLVSHHPDRDADIRQETIQRINRYTGRIAGKIVNLVEYFDRLRKKKSFFSEEESMAVAELLAMVLDITGYVSDYLAGRIHNLDAGILAHMEEQTGEDAGEFRSRAMDRLSKSGNSAIRTNLTVVETLGTIESIVRDLDRIASFAARL